MRIPTIHQDQKLLTGKKQLRSAGLILTKALSSILGFLLLINVSAYAQQVASRSSAQLPTQQLRGVVVDAIIQAPMEGVTISLPALQLTALTDNNGVFRFPSVPVGVYQINISHIGYKEVVLDNISINSGKEVVLTVGIENKIQTAEAVVVKATSKRNRPLNEMSTVSARAFTVEETQKYAAAVNDPSRMATAFPGVMTTDDGNNNIIIRGNSPTGLLWRMEGVDIPNPNHFSSTGGSGGGISILSTQLLSNSDFITGAFAAEYGNAMSGVFDLKLRKGNNEKREYTLQAGLLGLNVAAEGPIREKGGSSFLANYRYSTLSLLSKIGVPLNAAGTTNFQDLSYNFYLPTKRAGTFTFFGFGGLSSQDQKAQLDSLKWESRGDRYTSEFVSNTAATGITHSLLIGNRTHLRSALAFSYNKIGDDYRYIQDDYNFRTDYIDRFITKKWTLTSSLNHKFSARSTMRAGIIVSHTNLNYYQQSKENETAPIEEVINTKDNTQTVQGFVQEQYKLSNDITLNAGLHYLHLLYNNTNALEPRASIKWDVNRKTSLAIGYGMHSQSQALGVYFAKTENNDGTIMHPNKNLDLSKAHHVVLSYRRALGRNTALKAEAYYQHLFNVPVSTSDTNTFSMLNVQSEYITDPLVNNGKGRNYGLELSLEKYLSHHFYYTINTSLYQSKYTAADGIEYNTRFNGGYLANIIAGKEWVYADGKKTFGINLKTIYAGGLRNTPIDEASSIASGYAIYYQKRAYTEQNPAYFRTDLRLSMKWNRAHLTSTLSLDIQNLTNRQNVYGEWFDSEKGEVVTSYQTGLLPILNYKVEF